MVLRALETCLRDVSSEVVRYGDQITLHGLGPSPKAVNYQDTTVLSVSAEDNKTIINADVSFQASAILGDVQQDAVVRSKLEKVFDQMRMQIDLESRASAAYAKAMSQTPVPSSSPLPDVPTSENLPLAAPAASVGPTPVASLETASENSPLVTPPASVSAAPVAPLETKEEPASENAPVASVSAAPVAPLETKEEPAFDNAPVAAAAASFGPTPVAALETKEEPAEHFEARARARDSFRLREPQEVEEPWDEEAAAGLVAMLRRQIQAEEEDPEPEPSRRWMWVVTAIVALFLVAGGVYLLRFRNKTVASRSAATVSAPAASAPTTPAPAASASTTPAPTASVPTASAPAASVSTAPAQPVATPAASSPADGERTVTKIDAGTIGRPPASPDSSALPAPKVAVADPAVWLEGWATAMRSRDPAAQASFYADPVNQYINRRNVTHDALVQAKRADIGRRHGGWTFSANDVVVENKTPSEATVRLVKHYMVQMGPSQVSEIFVKTRLQLKVVDGQWKIASEEEIRTPAVARVNPIDQ